MQFELCHWKTVACCTCCALKMTLMTLQEHSVDWLPKIIWPSLCSNYTTSEDGYKAQMSLMEVPKPGLNFAVMPLLYKCFHYHLQGAHPCTALPTLAADQAGLRLAWTGNGPVPPKSKNATWHHQTTWSFPKATLQARSRNPLFQTPALSENF